MGQPKTTEVHSKMDIKALDYLKEHNITDIKQLSNENIEELYEILEEREDA